MDFQLTSEQQRLQSKCRELAADFVTRAAAHDRDASHPAENYERLREEGFLAPQNCGAVSQTLLATGRAPGDPRLLRFYNGFCLQRRPVSYRREARWTPQTGAAEVRSAMKPGILSYYRNAVERAKQTDFKCWCD